jgi:hypothetical protein
MERGGYLPPGYKFDPVVIKEKLPLELPGSWLLIRA